MAIVTTVYIGVFSVAVGTLDGIAGHANPVAAASANFLGPVGGILIAELIATFFEYSDMSTSLPTQHGVHNTRALGQVIYTDYIYLFQLAGLILLVAMVGAIALTLRRRSGVRRQVISEQNSRTRQETIRLAKVQSGKGAEETEQC